jgi:ubiquinol-cytochrome c reductase cytochrome b subunit
MSIYKWLNERVDLDGMYTGLLDRKVPSGLSWAHTLGSATLAVFVVQALTGIALAMYYAPSPDHAYDSVRYIQTAVISGPLVRGIHHWGASAMVVLVVAHMIRVFTMGAYKYPREANWLLGVVLFILTMAFGFTGYLLPWDQKAYWATQVGTNIAGTTPVIGDILVKLLRGGSQLGAGTLTRFYAMHVLLFPMLIAGVIGLHMVLVIRQGIAPKPKLLEDGSPLTTSDAQYPAYYQAQYKEAKRGDQRFWPDVIAKDAAVAVLTILVLVLLAKTFGAGLEAPADPSDSSYKPLPEWYFLPFFQLLKLVPGSLESVVAVGIPGAGILALLFLPFYDRKSTRSFRHRPWSMAILGTLMVSCALLIGAAYRDIGPVVEPDTGRPLTSAERAGRALFKGQGCNSCHQVGANKPTGKAGDLPDAPDLTEVGLRHTGVWMHSFMEDPLRFHKNSKMPAFGPPILSHQEIEELSRYMSSLRGKNGDAKQPQFVDTFPETPKHKEP